MTDALADHLREHRRIKLPRNIVCANKGVRFGLCPRCSRYSLYVQGLTVRCRYKDCQP